MAIEFKRCKFVPDTEMSKRRDWIAYFCVAHSCRTTSAMRECWGVDRGEIESHQDWNLKHPVRKNGRKRALAPKAEPMLWDSVDNPEEFDFEVEEMMGREGW